MNDLVLICLIFYIFIRILGLGVSIDFYYDTKDKKFLIFIICWIVWIFAAFFPMFSALTLSNSQRELYLVLNAIFAMTGGFFYLWGLFKFFMSIQFKIMMIILITILLIPFLMHFFINYSISVRFSNTILTLLLISTYIIPPLKKKDFIKYLGKSIRWYYGTIILFSIYLPVSIITSMLGESYGLYDSNNNILIILNYVPAITATIIAIILLLHLEYTISSQQKYELN